MYIYIGPEYWQEVKYPYNTQKVKVLKGFSLFNFAGIVRCFLAT